MLRDLPRGEGEGLTITVNDENDAYYGGNYCTHLKVWSDNGGPIPDVDEDSFVPVLPSDGAS